MEETLAETLANALPANTQFTIHHISTPPTKCDALFSATTTSQPERTYRESHLLLASINEPKRDHEANLQQNRVIPTLAIETIIYTTRRLSTLFVSKADSTGYLSLLNLPAGSPSPARSICTAFISYLVRNRQRPRTRLVVSLFARAQDQYLFPGSVDNGTKHVLDDRSLVKWWCKVLDPVIRNSDGASKGSATVADQGKLVESQPSDGNRTAHSAMGYLIVPGFDRYELTAFFPASWRTDPPNRKRWKCGHPLFEIADAPDAPPRCLIPHFPDDPKARFLDDLDQELPSLANKESDDSPSKKKLDRWKSVSSLDQFWEMMAFRQECSSGRLVGFIWAVFSPDESESGDCASRISQMPLSKKDAKAKKLSNFTEDPICQLNDKPSQLAKGNRRKQLKGPIVTRQPRIKPTSSSALSSFGASPSMDDAAKRPEQTEYYCWPERSRGEIILSEKDYTRTTEMLLRLDFSNLEIALSSFTRWIQEVSILARSPWGYEITGKKKSSSINAPSTLRTNGSVPMLQNGVSSIDSKHLMPQSSHDSLKRKTEYQEPSQRQAVNVLSSGLVKKKKKVVPMLVQQQ